MFDRKYELRLYLVLRVKKMAATGIEASRNLVSPFTVREVEDDLQDRVRKIGTLRYLR